MKLKADKKYVGYGNCLGHAIRFKIKYGGSIKLSWNERRQVPSFRIHHKNSIYRFRSYNKNGFPLYFKGRTIAYKNKSIKTCINKV